MSALCHHKGPSFKRWCCKRKAYRSERRLTVLCSQNLFIFGLGYTAAGIAREAQRQGWSVASTSRDPDRFTKLQSPTHTIYSYDPAAGKELNGAALGHLAECQYVLTSIPPVAAKLYDPVIRNQHKVLRQAVQSPGNKVSWLGYLSSTGVYGDRQGAWVDESTEPQPISGRGVVRLEHEIAWRELAEELKLQLTIFRLGGIYGPGRSVLDSLNKAASQLRSSQSRRKQQKFISRVHVADISAAVVATMTLHQQQQQAMQQQLSPTQAQEQQKLPQHQQQQQQEGQEDQQEDTWLPQQQQQQELGVTVAARPLHPVGALQMQPLVQVLNVVDDEPAPRHEVEVYARECLRRAGRRGSMGDAGSGEGVTGAVSCQEDGLEAGAAPGVASHVGSSGSRGSHDEMTSHSSSSSSGMGESGPSMQGSSGAEEVAGAAAGGGGGPGDGKELELGSTQDMQEETAEGKASKAEGASSRARSSGVMEEKRVRNTALKKLLGDVGRTLLAPTYREGLELIEEGTLLPFEPADVECLY